MKLHRRFDPLALQDLVVFSGWALYRTILTLGKDKEMRHVQQQQTVREFIVMYNVAHITSYVALW